MTTYDIFAKGIAPMEPTLHRLPPLEEGWVHQVKWDGVRIITYTSQGQVVLRNRKGNLRSDHYPELQQLQSLSSISPCILDGEMIAFGESGMVSFPKVLRRDLLTNATRLAQAIRQIPIHYMLFDIPFYKGRSIHQLPLEERRALLQDAVSRLDGPFYIAEDYMDGQALYRSTSEMGMEGIVSKRLGSPYLYGTRTDFWRKAKHVKRLLTVVGGLSVRGKQVNSLLLGLYEGDKLRFIGKAGSGLREDHLRQLTAMLSHVAAKAPCPFQVGPRPPTAGVYFLPPALVAEVEYLEWTSDLSLRSPVVCGFRDEDPQNCQWV